MMGKNGTQLKIWYVHATMNPDGGGGRGGKKKPRFVLHVFSNANAKWKPVHSNQTEAT